MDSTKQIVADTLGVENSLAWNIVDSARETSPLAHYADNADMTRWGDLRGVVVDTKAKTIVAKSFGFAPTIVESYLHLNPMECST